jgi:hypothetical protein
MTLEVAIFLPPGGMKASIPLILASICGLGCETVWEDFQFNKYDHLGPAFLLFTSIHMLKAYPNTLAQLQSEYATDLF